MRDVKLGRKDFDDVQKAAVRSEQALKDKLKVRNVVSGQ